MKILTVANEKGGVGKSLLATQFAYYAALKFGLRVVVLDFDQQGNSSSILEHSGYLTPAPCSSFELITSDRSQEISCLKADFVICRSDPRLSDLESTKTQELQNYHSHLVGNLKAFEAAQYDLVIIDTNPDPDVRCTLGLLCCTHLISPVSLNREPLDGIKRLLVRVKDSANFNHHLPDGFLGIVPNLLESSWRFQLKNANDLTLNYGGLLLKSDDEVPECCYDADHKLQPVKDAAGECRFVPRETFCAIKSHAALAEAQQRSQPIWELAGGMQAWGELKRAFFSILEALQIKKPDLKLPPELQTLLLKLQKLYGPLSASRVLRHFFLTDNVKTLPGLSLAEIQQVRVLRTMLPFMDA